MNLNNNLHVINEDRFIYKIVSYTEVGSSSHCLSYELELVAGWEYIHPDYNNKRGFVDAEAFIDDVQNYSFTVYPLQESLGERLEEEGFKVIDINDYEIHPYFAREVEGQSEIIQAEMKALREWRIANGYEIY